MVRKIVTVLLLTILCVTVGHAMENDKQHNTMSGMEHVAPTIQLEVYKITNIGDKKIVQIKLKNIRDNKPITVDNLSEVHTKKIHILIIDDSLQDYSHLHPRALNNPGLYEFEWQPKNPTANYYIWVDLQPLSTNAEEYDQAKLVVGTATTAKLDRSTVMQQKIQGYDFKLSFDSKTLRVGKPVMGTIIITDSKGKPVTDLEPVLGAFAHIVAFSDDLKTVNHVHPMGREPSLPSDRGGPELQFHLIPEQAGFMKLFAQIKINGKELFVPFGVTVYAK